MADPGFASSKAIASFRLLQGVVAQLCLPRIHFVNPCGYTGRMSKPSPARYRTTNWSCYNASLKKRGSLLAGQGDDPACAA